MINVLFDNYCVITSRWNEKFDITIKNIGQGYQSCQKKNEKKSDKF